MKTLLLALAIVLGLGAPFAHTQDYSLPRYMSKHTWAIDNTFNCRVPSKVYSIQLDADNDAVIWRDANGSTDIEQINTRAITSMVMFSTSTVQSLHRGEGEAIGTTWFYVNINNEMIRVDKNGRLAHYIVRCDDSPRPSPPPPVATESPACFASSDDGVVNVRETPNGALIGPIPSGTPLTVLGTYPTNRQWSRIQTPWLARVGRVGVVATSLIQCN